MAEKYLMIRNPGVCPIEAFTVMGVSTTRFAECDDTLGRFGTGIKNSIGLLLRNNIKPVAFSAKRRLDFDTVDMPIDDGLTKHTFNRITVRYTGSEIVMEDGRPKLKTYNRTEELDYTTEAGVDDWTDLAMAMREFVANAIDRTLRETGSINEVEIEVYDGKPRAKDGKTAVYIPYTEEVERFYKSLNKRFLHFGENHNLKCNILDKRGRNLEEGSTGAMIYKHGVFVREITGKPSLFDYNFGDELRLNDARTIDEWDVRSAVARSFRDASVPRLFVIFRALLTGQDTYETMSMDNYYLSNDGNEEKQAERRKNWREAWDLATGGSNAVMTSGIPGLETFIAAKGYAAKTISRKEWYGAMRTYDIPSEADVLTKSEKAGRVLSDPTPDMLTVLDNVWALLERFNLLNGRQKPVVKGFTTVMDGGTEKKGESDYEEGIIYIHTDHGIGQNHYLKQLMLEECVHHCTNSQDFSRDIQDFCFRLITVALL